MKKFLFLFLVLALIFSCKKTTTPDALSLSETWVTMNTRAAHQVNLLNHGVLDSAGYWVSSNPWAASLVNTYTGYVESNHVGTTILTVYKDTTALKCTIVVEPKSLLYAEPYFKRGTQNGVVGGTRQAVIDYEKTTGRTLLYNNGRDTLIYKGENSNIIGLKYIFVIKSTDTYQEGALDNAVVSLSNTTQLADLQTYLVERYDYAKTQADGFVLYKSAADLNNTNTFYAAYNQNPDNSFIVKYFWSK